MVTAMLFSRGRLRLLRGDAEGSFSDLLEVGRRGAALGFRTVATVPWRSTAALALARLDRHDDAVTLAEQELGIARSAPRDRAPQTFEQLVLDFLTNLEQERGLARNTIDAYRSDLVQLGAFLAHRDRDARILPPDPRYRVRS